MDYLNIFYESRYKYIMKTYESKLKTKHIVSNNITYKYVNNNVYVNNNIDNISDNGVVYELLSGNFFAKFRTFKNYLHIAKKTGTYWCISCPASNYNIKKYTNITTTHKNILLFNYFPDNDTGKFYYTVSENTSIFSNYGYYLYNYAKDCTIYDVLTTDNNGKYNLETTNIITNNTHRVIAYKTDFFYKKEIINTIIKQLKNIQFDIIMIHNGFFFKKIFFKDIKLYLIYMYIISRSCGPKTIVFVPYRDVAKPDQINTTYIQIIIFLKNLFKKISLFVNIFYYASIHIKLYNIDKNSKIYKDFKKIINNILSDKKTIIFECKNENFDDINNFIKKYDNIVRKKFDIINGIASLRQHHYFIYKIIKSYVENKQNLILYNKKYNKYLDPP